MQNKIKNNLKKIKGILANSGILACVSGGADSVAMLLALSELKSSMGFRLYIAHLNHCLRGKDSDDDERYVIRLAKRLGIPVITAKEDAGFFARRHKISLEDAARRLRYDFFMKTAEGLAIRFIATAHTSDDQAETILMRIMRGSGLRGLKGIGFTRKMQNYFVIRPMLNVSRKEVEAYLKHKKVKARTDKTNLKADFLRNKIRLRLIPLLEKSYNKNIKELLSKQCDILSKDYEYLDAKFAALFKRLSRPGRGGQVYFLIRDFQKHHIAAQRALARKAIEEIKGTLDSIDYRHWEEIESLLNERPSNSVVHLPGQIEVLKRDNRLVFSKKKSADREKNLSGPVFLKAPGSTFFNRYILKATFVKLKNNQTRLLRAEGSGVKEYLDAGKIDFPITVSLRRPGDKMVPLGMSGYKKVSDIFTDEKILLKKRETIPIVKSASGEILWLCGIRISDKFKITGSTQSALKLEIFTR